MGVGVTVQRGGWPPGALEEAGPWGTSINALPGWTAWRQRPGSLVADLDDSYAEQVVELDTVSPSVTLPVSHFFKRISS